MSQPADTGSKAKHRDDPATPQEIVIYCEGFGAGPGGGWFVELSFLGLNEGGFSVFRRSDGTVDYEWEENEQLSQDVFLEDGSWHVEIRASRIATIEKPLTWRRALGFARRLECIRIGREDISRIRVSGVKSWQRDVIVNALARHGGIPNLSPFFSALTDEELQTLHERLGGLLSTRALKVLPGLASAIRRAGFRKSSLRRIAEIAGVGDPWDLRALKKALESCGEKLPTKS